MSKHITAILLYLSIHNACAQIAPEEWCEKAKKEPDPFLKEQYANQALKLDSTNAWAYLLRGLAKRRQGDNTEAINDFTRAIRIDAKYTHAYGHRAMTYYNLNNKEEAIRSLDTLLLLEPMNAQVFNERGVIKSELGLLQEAQEDYNRSISLKPTALTYTNLGSVKYRRGMNRVLTP